MIYVDSPCHGCEMRAVGCHGREPDGSWRCQRWAKYMKEQEGRYNDIKVAVDMSEYNYSTKSRCMRFKKNGR